MYGFGELAVFPHPFNFGLNLRGLNVLDTHPGRVRYISSVEGANGNPGTYKRMLASIVRAFDTAKADDLLVVMPGHAETITGVGGLAADVAGIQCVGLGGPFRRPQILMDGAATVTAAISAAGVGFRNLQFRAGHADVATCFGVGASAKGFQVIGCEFVDNVADENFLRIVDVTSTTDNHAEHLQLIANHIYSIDAAAREFLQYAGTIDNMKVIGNRVLLPGGTNSALIRAATGKLFRGVEIGANLLQHAMTANELLIFNDAATNSGIIYGNLVGHADVTGAHDLGIDGLGCRLFDNKSVSTGSLSGLLLPAADVDL